MKRLILILLLAFTPLAFAQGPTSVVHSADFEASHVIKNGPGYLVSLVGYNSGAAQFIQVHNYASLPADGTVPTYSFTVGASQNFSLDIPITGARFSTGIVVCNSSTANTKTVGGNDVFFTAVVQ